MSYANRDQSGVVARTPTKKQDPLVERIMMIAERLVKAEQEIAALKKKVK
jgi:hypothetical protein